MTFFCVYVPPSLSLSLLFLISNADQYITSRPTWEAGAVHRHWCVTAARPTKSVTVKFI